MTRFGIALPSGDRTTGSITGTTIADAARATEAAGFTSAWAFDSIGRGWLHADPLIALSVAASVTRGLEFGTGVLQVPLRNPVELAQRVLTLHLVSGGRFLFGVGAGSTAADFEALGLDFAARFRRMDASLAIMRRLWKGEAVNGASLAPVWPAVTRASARPSFTRFVATRIVESFFSRSAFAGCSSIPTTWLAWTISTFGGSSPAIRRMVASSPTSRSRSRAWSRA